MQLEPQVPSTVPTGATRVTELNPPTSSPVAEVVKLAEYVTPDAPAAVLVGTMVGESTELDEVIGSLRLTGEVSDDVESSMLPDPTGGFVTAVIDRVTLSPAAMVLGTATLMMEPFPAIAAESPLLPPPLPDGFV